MKKIMAIVCVIGLVVTFFAISECSAAGLSSKQIRRVQEGVELITAEAKGPRKQGYKQLKGVGISTVPYLIAVLEDKSVNRDSRKVVCDLLGDMKAKDAVPALIYTLKNKSYTVRAAACKALGKIADPQAVFPLLGMLKDEEGRVKETAIYALISFDETTIPVEVEKLLKDTEERVRIAAATLLNDKLDSRTAEACRQALQKDKVGEVRAIAAAVLGGLKDIDAVDALMETVVEDPDYRVRESAAEALGKIGEKKAVSALIDALNDEYKDVQLQASYSLTKLIGKNFKRDYDKWMDWYQTQGAEK